jgi:hypothetical protein
MLRGTCRAGEKLDHEAIEKPGLLDLTGMAGSRQDLQLAIAVLKLRTYLLSI